MVVGRSHLDRGDSSVSFVDGLVLCQRSHLSYFSRGRVYAQSSYCSVAEGWLVF